ncbi:GNAT family N-acetyltransferase [Glutamicibacter sp. JC586]|uniref:GNAT family N-acetyltransferase n=1 Tax=Glutamicibacter sp. JC586 TaxID=2590552 RepID=UPI00135929BD|nr:GNAT family N-acetyltransferase [Glutamicibacter sp. JC586]
MNQPAHFTATCGQLLIELATVQDYQRVGELTAQSYFAAGHFDSPDHQYLKFVQKVAARAKDTEIYVVRRHGEILGSMTLIQHGSSYADIALPGELEIRMLSVDPKAQRSGIGKAMVQASIDRARRESGLTAVSLTTGESWHSARALYESMGFIHQSQRDWLVPGTEIQLVVYRYDLEQ